MTLFLQVPAPDGEQLVRALSVLRKSVDLLRSRDFCGRRTLAVDSIDGGSGLAFADEVLQRDWPLVRRYCAGVDDGGMPVLHRLVQNMDVGGLRVCFKYNTRADVVWKRSIDLQSAADLGMDLRCVWTPKIG